MKTKIDNHNENSLELFAGEGFALLREDTRDGASLAAEKEREAAEKAMADAAQCLLF